MTTVGELLTVDPVRLSGMRGVADSTRRQITRRLKAWRERLGDPRQSDAFREGADLDVQQAAEVLLAAVGSGRATSRREVARLLLGIGTDLEPFSSNAQIGAHLSEPVTPGRISQIMGSLQSAWAKDEQALATADGARRRRHRRAGAPGRGREPPRADHRHRRDPLDVVRVDQRAAPAGGDPPDRARPAPGAGARGRGNDLGQHPPTRRRPRRPGRDRPAAARRRGGPGPRGRQPAAPGRPGGGRRHRRRSTRRRRSSAA